MFKDVLNSFGNYTFYAEIALIIFFVVFVAVGIRVMMKPKGEMDHMADLPNEKDDGPVGEEMREEEEDEGTDK
ncbi:hypothetical protein KS4_01280 [Poriferisphaera corsica]|uniref:Cbb3-type cytochrome c oxidase subunit 3 n=2 Tax=Poriferisphaera corsica TaxID=2528020 RepID=A0A517YPF3_9BACT|nr:hypothetical protein KS4_01280 [Poriferisphaera corsica]